MIVRLFLVLPFLLQVQIMAQSIHFHDFYPTGSDTVIWGKGRHLLHSHDDLLADSLYQIVVQRLQQGDDPKGSLMIAGTLAEYFWRFSSDRDKAKGVLDHAESLFQSKYDTISFAFACHYRTRALHYDFLRNAPQRLLYYQRSYDILQRLDPYHAAMPVILHDLMQSNFAVRNIVAGFEYYDKLQEVSLRANNPFYLASAYMGAGNLLKFYNPAIAVKYFDHVEFLTDKYQLEVFREDPFYYISVGTGQTATNQHRRALEFYREGLEVINQIASPNMRHKQALYYYIGVSYKNMGMNDEAILYLDTAMTLEMSLTGKTSFEYHRTLNLISVTLNNAGRFEEALPLSKDVLEYYLSTRGKHDTYYTQHGLRQVSRAYRGLGRYMESLELAQKAICYFLQIDEIDDVYVLPEIEHLITPQKNYLELEYNIYDKIEVFQDMYKLSGDEALLPLIMDHFEMVMRITDIHASVAMTPGTLFDLSSRYKYFSNMLLSFIAETNLSEMYQKEAYLLIAKSKAYSLLAESLQNRERGGVSEEDLPTENISKTQLTERLLIMNPASDASSYESTVQQLLRLEKEEFLYRANNPVISEKVLVPQLADTRNINIHQGIEGDELVMDIYVDKQSLHLFIITHDSFEFISQPLTDNFTALTQSFLRAVRTGNINDQQKQSRLLSGLLFSNVNFQNKKHLIIVPDENLHLIPFDLLEYNGRYLIESFSISTRYTSHLFRKTPSELSPKIFMSFAPVFDDGDLSAVPEALRSIPEMEEMDEVLRDHENFVALPATVVEQTAISDLLTRNGFTGNAFFRRDATKENFRKYAPDADILHVATHGFANRKYPDRSGIVLHQTQSGIDSGSGIMFMGEIANMNINSDLVVLSACHTGSGSILRGEGVMSITKGFLSAGASHVLASLWKVHDQKTQQLMVIFYTYLLEGHTYADALRLAKLDCIQKDFLPMDWAGFSLIGN